MKVAKIHTICFWGLFLGFLFIQGAISCVSPRKRGHKEDSSTLKVKTKIVTEYFEVESYELEGSVDVREDKKFNKVINKYGAGAKFTRFDYESIDP